MSYYLSYFNCMNRNICNMKDISHIKIWNIIWCLCNSSSLWYSKQCKWFMKVQNKEVQSVLWAPVTSVCECRHLLDIRGTTTKKQEVKRKTSQTAAKLLLKKKKKSIYLGIKDAYTYMCKCSNTQSEKRMCFSSGNVSMHIVCTHGSVFWVVGFFHFLRKLRLPVLPV